MALKTNWQFGCHNTESEARKVRFLPHHLGGGGLSHFIKGSAMFFGFKLFNFSVSRCQMNPCPAILHFAGSVCERSVRFLMVTDFLKNQSALQLYPGVL